MKFITKRTSETGKKFAEVERKLKEALEAQKAFIKDFRAVSIRPCGNPFVATGGVSAVKFPDKEVICGKTWKRVEGGGFMPKLSSGHGKKIQKRIDEMPRVFNEDLNNCVDPGIKCFCHIGFTSNEQYFGFSIIDEWKVKIPDDCTEITTAKYKKMFDSKT